MDKTSQDLRVIFQTAVDAVVGKKSVRKELKKGNYPDTFHVIAIGKAADSMLQGVPDEKIISALVLSKHHHISEQTKQNKKFICLESDHPIPKENSLASGEALLHYLKNLPENQPYLFLISGGTSALVEVLQEDWDLAQLEELNRYLLANGYPIDQINAVRREISQIKGGGLWHFIKSQEVYCLMVSDVKGDKPADIGSGLLFAVNDNKLPDLPQKWLNKIQPYLNNTSLIPPASFKWKIIASLELAKKASEMKAKELGYKVQIIPKFIEGDASKAAIHCVQKIRKHPNIMFIWGGETTVKLPKNAGIGGRNQHLALSAAIKMQDLRGAYLLAAGTDGSDGTSTATGAIVSNMTVNSGEQKNLIASDYLKKANSNTFFNKTGGLLKTGSTGTNVMDLVIAIHYEK